MSSSVQKRPTRTQLKQESVPPTSQGALDSQALTTALLGAWAWHSASASVIHHKATEPLPVEFASLESYRRLLQPLIIDEACTALKRQFQEEVQNGHVFKARLHGVTSVSDLRADVECKIKSGYGQADAVRRKFSDGSIVLLCSVMPPRGNMPLEALCTMDTANGNAGSRPGYAGRNSASQPQKRARLDEHSRDATRPSATEAAPSRQGAPSDAAGRPSATTPAPSSRPPQPRAPTPPLVPSNVSARSIQAAAAAPPLPSVVLAGYVKFPSKGRDDNTVLEMQAGFVPMACQGAAARHPCPEAWSVMCDAFARSQVGNGGSGELEWYVVSVGSLVTHQREMAALEAMARHTALLPCVACPSSFLRTPQGWRQLQKAWPEEVRTEKYVQHIRDNFDESQQTAIEYCASLVARPEELSGPLLPIVLIQGPPGTGKTHTVKGILNTWHLVHFQRYYASLERMLEEQMRGLAPQHDGGLDMSPLGNAPTGERIPRPRILVCAPSNAATDELLSRIVKDGFMDQGSAYHPRVVRVGSEAAKDHNLSPEVQQVWVERMVKDMLSLPRAQVDSSLRDRSNELGFAQTKVSLASHKLRQNLLDDERRRALSMLVQAREDERSAQNNVNRWKAVQEFIFRTRQQRDAEDFLARSFMEEAEIVFTTLSSTGRRLFTGTTRAFELVLVDEAAQASEVATLQALVLGSGRVVMVGDPKQLPATVLSKAAKALNMERSLFERLMQAGWPSEMLHVQYRMHRNIRSFPSKHFYDNQLRDGASVTNRPAMPFYEHNLLKPYVVFDVEAGKDRQQGDGGSRYNLAEVNMALALFQELHKFMLHKQDEAGKNNMPAPPGCVVGVITPYREQCNKLREAFADVLGPELSSEVKIDTVDSFQGKQMNVIILSCVRAAQLQPGQDTNTKALLGFVEDTRRMNVAITRAQNALWILGNISTLSRNDDWRALFDDARARKGGYIVENADAHELFPNVDLWDGKPRTGAKPRQDQRAGRPDAAEPSGKVNNGSGEGGSRSGHAARPARPPHGSVPANPAPTAAQADAAEQVATDPRLRKPAGPDPRAKRS